MFSYVLAPTSLQRFDRGEVARWKYLHLGHIIDGKQESHPKASLNVVISISVFLSLAMGTYIFAVDILDDLVEWQSHSARGNYCLLVAVLRYLCTK